MSEAQATGTVQGHQAGQHGHQHGHGDQHGHAHVGEQDWAALANATEEFGEVFAGFVANAIVWVDELRDPTHGPIRQVIDIGSGPGVAASAFAAAFPAARVTAADSSPAMLERASARAVRLGLSDRLHTALAELPDGVDSLDQADLVWASMALHHVGDEVEALRAMGRLLRPGGLLVIAEFPEEESHLTLLPPSIEQDAPGLRQRLAEAGAAWFASMRRGLAGSTPSRPLTEMVATAGLEVVGWRVDRIRLDAPLSAAATRVAARNLEMIGKQMADFLSQSDIDVLDDLCDLESDRGLIRRADLFVEAARLVVAAGRPSA